MRYNLAFVLVLTLTQFGCGFEFGEDRSPFKFDKLPDEVRPTLEEYKRDLLKIEDLEIGDGPVAAWHRKLSADIEVRYADGTLVFKGTVFTYEGFFDPVG